MRHEVAQQEYYRTEHIFDKFITSTAEVATNIYACAAEHGFWPPEGRNVGEALMLAVSELGEAMEAHRKGNPPDEHVPQLSSLEVEIADCIIRLLDLGHGLGLKIPQAIVHKLQFNRERPFKHGKLC